MPPFGRFVLAETGVGDDATTTAASTGVITLHGVQVTAASGTLLKAAAGNWGTSGSNGGTAVLTADGQVLAGDLVADGISSIALVLQYRRPGIFPASDWTRPRGAGKIPGLHLPRLRQSLLFCAILAIDAENTAKSVSLTLDASSTWTVTADSYLSCLSDSAGISGTTITNITGNGHMVYYSASACSALGGLTYTLNGGGTLQPGG